jgi:hypothetical protein
MRLSHARRRMALIACARSRARPQALATSVLVYRWCSATGRCLAAAVHRIEDNLARVLALATWNAGGPRRSRPGPALKVCRPPRGRRFAGRRASRHDGHRDVRRR